MSRRDENKRRIQREWDGGKVAIILEEDGWALSYNDDTQRISGYRTKQEAKDARSEIFQGRYQSRLSRKLGL